VGLKHSRQISMGDLTLMGRNVKAKEMKSASQRVIKALHHSLMKKQGVVKEIVKEGTEEEQKVGEMKLNFLEFLTDNLINKTNGILCKMSALKSLNLETSQMLKELETNT